MKHSSTSSFILTLKLNTTKRQDAVLNDRFFAGWCIRNQIAKFALKQFHKLNIDKRYKALLAVKKSKERDAALSDIRKEYSLSEAQLQHWGIMQQHRYKQYIDSNTTQKIASRVWQGVSACLFGKGDEIKACRFSDFQSMEGKSNIQGIRFKNYCIDWMGEHIAVQIRHNDTYAKEALLHRVKYCRIVRRPVGQRYHYYAQLILEGRPPQKHCFLTSGTVGLDQGTSTEAIVTDKQCILTEIAPERKDIADKVARLQQKMDRSRRIQNPENYNPDGTVINGAKQWRKSKRYKRLQSRYSSLKRQNAAYVHQEEEKLANFILETCGSDIITEPMEYKALQKRKKGFKFGVSLATHSPAKLLTILERKLCYIDKKVFFVDKIEYRASQYNHVNDSYTKELLSARSKLIGNHRVQRDLYSAFLLLCADNEVKPNRQVCMTLFPCFLNNQAQCISALKQSGKTYPSSFGLEDFV